jgi:hypothetical protein
MCIASDEYGRLFFAIAQSLKSSTFSTDQKESDGWFE